MVPADRAGLLPALTEHLVGEVAAIARVVPNDRLALQWDVCQEVLAWEGYYEPGPVDVRDETTAVLRRIGDAVPRAGSSPEAGLLCVAIVIRASVTFLNGPNGRATNGTGIPL